jgi:Tol biopolymer transport system component
MNADGSNQKRVSTWGPGDEQNCGPSIRENNPIFSPDGQKIAFSANRTGCYEYGPGKEKSDSERIANYGADSWPTLSSDSSNHNEIYTMDLGGSNVTRITTDGCTKPVWSSGANPVCAD